MSPNAVEKHGALWFDDPGWSLVYERYDDATQLLAAVTKHERLQVIRADVFHRFDNTEWPQPVWESVGAFEANFGPDDANEASQYAERIIRNYVRP